MLRISGFYDNNCTNGDGWRSVIFFSGCPHKCHGCHNPDTWDYGSGYDISVDGLIEHISPNLPLIDGVTLSGGEPFQERNIDQIIEFLGNVKAKGLDVWAYSGYTFEMLYTHKIFRKLLEQIDILVDGQYDKDLFEPDLKFRGSSNQRIIDVKRSITSGIATLLES
jgi:anaerobic ribonucleoside-triphosphate reductase activating protein